MRTFTESLKLRQKDVKPAAKHLASQHIEKGNFKKTLDLLKFLGKKVNVDKSTEGTSKAVWTIEGMMNEMKLPISDEMFKSLKKGDKIKIGFDSSIKKGNENTYVVKSKSKSAKYNLEKITLKNVANPVAQASYLYNRQGKVTMAQGDMAVTMSTAVKESVEETDEACWDSHKQVGMKKKGGKMVPNCVPKTEEILTKAARRDKDAKKAVKTLKDIRKGKYKGVKMANEGQKPVSQMTPAEKKADAEKRKEYKAYQKSKRNESVELDEAKAPGKLGPNASREDKINHTMKIMKMYPANKGKSEKELRKGATDYIDQFTNKNKRDDAYIAKMKAKKESKAPALKSSDYAKGTYQSAQAFKDKFAKKKNESVEESTLEEKTKWKMGDGRPRNGARIENDRFWNLPYDSLKYIAKDAGEAMKLNPTARKATTGPGNWADQVADAATVMQWRKKNGIKESKKFSDFR